MFQHIVVAQNDFSITRPRVEVVNELFGNMLDTAIFEMEKCGHTDTSSYFFYLYEMNGEGNYHCWLEAHTFSEDIFRFLPEKWDEGTGSKSFWPEGYFYYKGILCLVRTSYPGANFFFSNIIDTLLYPTRSLMDKNETEKNSENGDLLLLIYPSIRDTMIEHPYKIEIGCQ